MDFFFAGARNYPLETADNAHILNKKSFLLADNEKKNRACCG